MSAPARIFFMAALASLAAACSSSSASTGAPTDGDSGTSEAPCSIPNSDPGATCVKTVSGSLTDVSGAPLKKMVVSVCGNICYFGQSDDQGKFTVSVGQNIVPNAFAVLGHGRPDYVSLYMQLPKGVSGDVTVPPLRLPKYDTGVLLPADNAAATTITDGDVTLQIPDNVYWDLDVEDIELKDLGRTFRVGVVDAANFPSWAQPNGIVALWGLGPFSAKSESYSAMNNPTPPRVKLGVTVPNKTGLPAGSAVEFVVMGDSVLAPVNAGTIFVAATGTVSADGQTISTDAGQGISLVTWLGVRPKAM
jgi:hypothetical protein